jgi:hypothetical protein
MFDEQPDGDPHGECAAEIYLLKDELSLTFAALSAAQAENESIRTRIAALVEAARPFAGIVVDERIPGGHLVQCRVDAEYSRALSAALKAFDNA